MTPTSETPTARVRPSDGLYMETAPGHGCISTLAVSWLYASEEGRTFLGCVAEEVRSLLADTDVFRRYYDAVHFPPCDDTVNAAMVAYTTARQACRWAAGRVAEQLTPRYGKAFCDAAAALVVAALAHCPSSDGEPMVGGAVIELIAPTLPRGKVILSGAPPRPPSATATVVPGGSVDVVAELLCRLEKAERRLQGIEGGIREVLDLTRRMDATLPALVERLRRLEEGQP